MSPEPNPARHDRDSVARSALALLDEVGLADLSMRRIAAGLDVQPSALYHHVPNKQTLLALMADEIVREVRGYEPACVCRSLRESMLAIRDGADVVATASAFRLGASSVEALLASMVGADGARTLLLYTFGQAQATQTQLQAQAIGALPEMAAAARGAAVAGANGGATGVSSGGATGGAVGGADSQADLDQQLRESFDRGIEIILEGLSAAR